MRRADVSVDDQALKFVGLPLYRRVVESAFFSNEQNVVTLNRGELREIDDLRSSCRPTSHRDITSFREDCGQLPQGIVAQNGTGQCAFPFQQEGDVGKAGQG